MKHIAVALTLLLTSLSLISTSAEAKRLGGGLNLGKQRTMSAPQKQAAPAPAQANPAQAAGTPAKQGNKWLGPLAGIAAGLGLAALFSHLGLGEGMGMLLMILLLAVGAFFLFSMLRKKQQPAMQYAGASTNYDVPPQPAPSTTNVSADTVPQRAANIPADFPVESFLRSAKMSFIRLQAANDRKDLNDIREYTTPEMFAEISMQLQERGDAPQQTDVGFVNGELLEVVTENDLAIASVRLSGQLRENNAAPENFEEVWHVQKDLKDDNSVWLLAGIQQN
ncbi:MAG: 39S ribosomal protein L45 [Gammaproteobacteria bacterium]|nr:39S ribosomal protein L45 [Gammaproteobacteria bacterium]MBU1624566.1 39S ribosomal protein L45 [Gammaproteobacteria bacterium]MBU1982410.1 39S ribosomal protein L45 [Gammaproteobacteria bacterium]